MLTNEFRWCIILAVEYSGGGLVDFFRRMPAFLIHFFMQKMAEMEV